MPVSRSLDRVNADPYRLDRFVDAQAHGVHTKALNELQAGLKATHWMWFIFPQVAGLGTSPKSQRYAIGSLEEARAYLDHPVLGRRLVECAQPSSSTPIGPLAKSWGHPMTRNCAHR